MVNLKAHLVLAGLLVIFGYGTITSAGNVGKPLFFHMTFITQIFWNNHTVLGYGYPQTINTTFSSNIPMFTNDINYNSTIAAVFRSSFQTRTVPGNTYSAGVISESGTIEFAGGNIIHISTNDFSGYQSMNLNGWQGGMGGTTYQVTSGQGAYQGGTGVCNSIWSTPYNQCTFKVRIACGIWVDFDNQKESLSATMDPLLDIPDWARKDPEYYYDSSSSPFIPGPNNTAKLEFFFSMPLNGGNRFPAHDLGYATELFSTISLPKSGVPTVSNKFGSTHNTVRYSSFVWVNFNGNSLGTNYGEGGYLDFGKGNNMDFSTLALSGYFGNTGKWDGGFGAQFFVVSNGTGVFQNAIGVMLGQWQSPTNPAIFEFSIWGTVYVPASNLPNPPKPVSMPSASC